MTPLIAPATDPVAVPSTVIEKKKLPEGTMYSSTALWSQHSDEPCGYSKYLNEQ